MSNLSKAEILEEQQKWAMKYFDLAETPIKEWIADYLEEDPEVLFEDYKETYDIISTEADGQYYTFYLSTDDSTDSNIDELKLDDSTDDNTDNTDELKLDDSTDDNTSELKLNDNDTNNDTDDNTSELKLNDNLPYFNVTKQIIQRSLSIKHAVGSLLQSVYTVYPAVSKTMVNLKHRIEGIMPEFVEHDMYFRLKMINIPYAKKQQALQPIPEIQEQLRKIENVETPEVNKIRQQLSDLYNEQLNKFNSISEQEVSDAEKQCKLENEKLKHGPFLYVHANKNNHLDNDIIYKRLPQFGLRYQDPEDETLIDKLKKTL